MLPTEIKSECAVISVICSCATLDKQQFSTLVGVQQPSRELSWYYELINASVLHIHARNRVQLFIGNGLVHEGYMPRQCDLSFIEMSFPSGLCASCFTVIIMKWHTHSIIIFEEDTNMSKTASTSHLIDK